MPANDRIETLNATGKGGTRIRRDVYEAFREALLHAIPNDDEGVRFMDLAGLVEPGIPPEMLPANGSCTWYVTVVKLDLEARGEIERVPKATPQRVRRTR